MEVCEKGLRVFFGDYTKRRNHETREVVSTKATVIFVGMEPCGLLGCWADLLRLPKMETNRVCLVSSLPRTGVSRQVSEEVVRGIRLAIDEVKAKVGRFTLEYRDLDNSAAASGRWTSEGEAANARMAVQDSDVMAYIGTLNSGAARVSMPILIMQIC